jgi:hypothetical protein
LAFLAVFMAMVYSISLFIRKAAWQACLAAIGISVVVGLASLLPALYGIVRRQDLAVAFVLAASLIRLLLMAGGTAIILFFTKVNIMWFVVWLGLFYICMLAVEVWLLIKTTNKGCRFKAEKK